MARKRLLTDPEMIELYLSGLDSYTIALRANCDATQVLDAVRAAGHQVRKRGTFSAPNRHSSIPMEQAAQLYRSGLSVQAVADRAGVTRSTMVNWLRQAGVRIRSLQEVANQKAIERGRK